MEPKSYFYLNTSQVYRTFFLSLSLDFSGWVIFGSWLNIRAYNLSLVRLQ